MSTHITGYQLISINVFLISEFRLSPNLWFDVRKQNYHIEWDFLGRLLKYLTTECDSRAIPREA